MSKWGPPPAESGGKFRGMVDVHTIAALEGDSECIGPLLRYARDHRFTRATECTDVVTFGCEYIHDVCGQSPEHTDSQVEPIGHGDGNLILRVGQRLYSKLLHFEFVFDAGVRGLNRPVLELAVDLAQSGERVSAS